MQCTPPCPNRHLSFATSRSRSAAAATPSKYSRRALRCRHSPSAGPWLSVVSVTLPGLLLFTNLLAVRRRAYCALKFSFKLWVAAVESCFGESGVISKAVSHSGCRRATRGVLLENTFFIVSFSQISAPRPIHACCAAYMERAARPLIGVSAWDLAGRRAFPAIH